MNKTSLAIPALVIVAATAMGFFGFVATTQSAAAQDFNTSNSASQSATQTGTATSGGASGGAATGGTSGSASVTQIICQQIAQSGAFGSSSNTVTNCSS
jgi:hypothetical protein